MTMRRLSLIFVVVAVLAGCSSGSTNVARSTKSTGTTASPTSATPTTVAPTTAPPSAVPAGGEATSFCDAFKQIQAVTGTGTPEAVGTTFQASANAMRKYAPPEIKDAAVTYADLMETIGKAAQAGTMDEAALQKAIATGLAGKASDIGKVAVWVAKNCQL